MSMGLAMGVGLMDGLEKSTATLMRVMEAKYKIGKDREMFDLDKKVKEAQLNKYAVIDPQRAKEASELFKLQTKVKEKEFELASDKVDNAKQNQEFLVGYQTALAQGKNPFPGIQPGQRVSMPGIIFYGESNLTAQKSSGGLTNPYPKPNATAEPQAITLPDTITTTSEAVKHLQSNYGMNENQAKDWIKNQK